MPVTSREILKSRSQTFDAAGTITGLRTFRVFSLDGNGNPDALLVEAAITAVNISKDDPWPDPSSLKASHIIKAERVDGHFDLVEIIWKYVGLVDDPDGLFTQTNMAHRRQLVKVYRKPPGLDFPLTGDLGNIGEADSYWFRDVAGFHNDISGFRETILIHKMSLVITEFLSVPIEWDEYIVHVGKRNSFPFQGAAIGKVVYVGNKSQSINSTITAVTHTFEYDDWFHLVQVAARDQSGRIRLESLGDIEVGLRVADFVMWRQPFPEFTDFISILDAPP